MKRTIFTLPFLVMLTVFILMSPNKAGAAGDLSCVFMKFTDDTRFDRIETVDTLSDLVLDKLINSGKFNFKETKVIDENMERILYEERAAEFQNAKASMLDGKFDKLFEGQGYNEDWAQTIATAAVGQTINPQITSSIGKAHNAEYLIQGTIINIGTGGWANRDVNNAITILSHVSSTPLFAGASAALGPVGMLMNGFGIDKSVIGLCADLRIIKADTGKVIWQKRVMGKNSKSKVKLLNGMVQVGSTKLNSDMYFKTVEDSANLIAQALIEDAAAGKLFVGE